MKSANNARPPHMRKKPERTEPKRTEQARIPKINSNNILDVTLSGTRERVYTNQGPRRNLDGTELNNKPEPFSKERSQPADGSSMFMIRRIKRGARRYDRGATQSSFVNTHEDNSGSLFSA